MKEIYLVERIDHCGKSQDFGEEIMFTPEGFTETEEAAEKLRERFDNEIEKSGPRYYVDGEEGFYPRFFVSKVKRLDR